MRVEAIRTAVVAAVSATLISTASAQALDEAEKELRNLVPLAEASTSLPIEAIVGARTDSSPIWAHTEKAPGASEAEHEKQAGALWTGRKFLSLGKAQDDRIVETRIADIAAPAGWTKEGDKLIHRESGLECPVSFDLANETSSRMLELTGLTAYDRRGLDVSCNYMIDGEASVTLYASFYPDLSLEEHAAGAAAAIRQNFTILGALPVAVVEVESKNAAPGAKLPAAVSGAFDVGEVNGVPYKTAIWLAKTHGWHVKARATYAQSDFTTEIVAAVIFGVNYVNVDMKNRDDPTTSGPEV